MDKLQNVEKNNRTKNIVLKIFVYALLIFWALLVLFPFYWMILTSLKGYGAYKIKEKRVIMCAIRKPQLPKAKEIVNETDSEAFMIITSANEIIGEGFNSHNTIL